MKFEYPEGTKTYGEWSKAMAGKRLRGERPTIEDIKGLRNPDTNQVYHCWHYCQGCGSTWTHSQGDWEDLKRHISLKHKDDWSFIITVPQQS